jgi:hypothetical protein
MDAIAVFCAINAASTICYVPVDAFGRWRRQCLNLLRIIRLATSSRQLSRANSLFQRLSQSSKREHAWRRTQCQQQ